MPQYTFPSKLKPGDEVRVVAPARSLALIGPESRQIAANRFAELGLKLTFGKHVNESDIFDSTSVQSRVEDLHAAFADPDVSAIFAVIGGHNSNQLLRLLDWGLIQTNPKIFCGFSDITVLNNAILAKAGLVTYSGPHYSTFGQKHYFEYTMEYFRACLFESKPISLIPSEYWTDDQWFIDQEDRHPVQNKGWITIQEGQAEGTIIGGNLCSLNLLQGTEYMPNLDGTIAFIEDDSVVDAPTFDRDLQSLIHQPQFPGVRGIVIGRFQKESNVTDEQLRTIIKNKPDLIGLPVIANVDFGHTDPKITFPIGGKATIHADHDGKILITQH